MIVEPGMTYKTALALAKAEGKQGLEQERDKLEIEKKKLAEKEKDLEQREKEAGGGKSGQTDERGPDDQPTKGGEGQPQGSSALKNYALMETARHYLRGDQAALAGIPTANESPLTADARKIALSTYTRKEGK